MPKDVEEAVEEFLEEYEAAWFQQGLSIRGSE